MERNQPAAVKVAHPYERPRDTHLATQSRANTAEECAQRYELPG